MLTHLTPPGANVPLSHLLDSASCQPVTMTSADGATSRGLLFHPKDRMSRVGVHLMHPRTDQSLNYNIAPLVAAGYTVLGRGGRSVNNDVDTVHEEAVADVAAGVRLLQDAGCEKVILLGNSGGGSLAAFYQRQATSPPAERVLPVMPYTQINLRDVELLPADGIALIGMHSGEGKVLLNMIDPSVTDERDPRLVDSRLDMYDPRNGFRLPLAESRYTAEYVAGHRAGQVARVARLDAFAMSILERRAEAIAAVAALKPDADQRRVFRLERSVGETRYMVIYRTTADPAMVDLTLEPDDRVAGGHDGNARPDLQNWGAAGFAHYLTPRAWLSTWSGLSSHAVTSDSLRHVTQPTLVVHYAGDVYTRLPEAEAIFDASAADDKEFHLVRHADHYGKKIEGGNIHDHRVAEGTDVVVDWMRKRFPAD